MPGRIRLIDGQHDVFFLPPPDFFRLTGRLARKLVPAETYPFEMFITEKREAEDHLRSAFARLGRPGADFEVASDRNHAFTMSGAVFSQTMICRDYLDILSGVLRSTWMKEKWSYSTSVELDVAIDGMCDCDFLLHDGTVYVLDADLAEFDFVRHFSAGR